MNIRAFPRIRSSRSRSILKVSGLIATCAATIGTAIGVVFGTAMPAPGATWMTIVGSNRAQFDSYSNEPIFLLAIGNDERPGISGRRGDAVHLIGINPAQHQASIINFPRDLGVSIAGHGRDKINAANTYGLRTTMDTVSQLTGVPIQFAAQVNFDQFIGLVNEMGGIDIVIPERMHDSFSGAFFEPGPNHLDGDAALRFSRDRHDYPNSDITRTWNQGQLLIAALGTLRSKQPGPAGTLRLLGSASRHVELENTSIGEVYDVARAALSVDPASIKNVTVPLGGGSGGNLSLGGGAQSLFDDFRDDGILQSH